MTPMEAEEIIEPVLEYMENHRVLWYYPKENDPVNFGRLLNNFFEKGLWIPPQGTRYLCQMDQGRRLVP